MTAHRHQLHPRHGGIAWATLPAALVAAGRISAGVDAPVRPDAAAEMALGQLEAVNG